MLQYDLEQVLNLLEICHKTYRRKMQDVFEHLSFYWDYEVIYEKKRGTQIPTFLVYEEKSPLEPYPKYHRLSERTLKEILFPILVKDPIQTAASLARAVYSKKLPSEIKISKKVFERYTSGAMKRWFGDGKEIFKGTEGHLGRNIWVTLVRTETGSYYQRMTEEQIEDFFAMCDINNRETMRAILVALNDQTFGEVQLHRVNKAIGKYLVDMYIEGRQKYNKKYGGYPFCVREKILNGNDSKKQ